MPALATPRGWEVGVTETLDPSYKLAGCPGSVYQANIGSPIAAWTGASRPRRGSRGRSRASR
jgi:hypothetical protein